MVFSMTYMLFKLMKGRRQFTKPENRRSRNQPIQRRLEVPEFAVPLGQTVLKGV